MAHAQSLLRRARNREGETHGELDRFAYGAVLGWAFDPAQPHRRVSVDVMVDGDYFETVVAQEFRPDLEATGVGDGFHAFSCALPQRALDSKPHRVEARITGTGIYLRNGPLEALHADHAHLGVFPGTHRPKPALAKKPKLAGPPGGKVIPELGLNGISVVIPTFNRSALMEETLRTCMECVHGTEVEFIVIDDGSTDDTPARLERLQREFPSLRWKRVPNGGQGQARNAGVLMATHEIVLFQGDDIRPASEHFYLHHLTAHRTLPFTGVAVLGKITWPDSPSAEISFTMSVVQGPGEEQFGFFGFMPYSFLDWRFFYTSNVSFKKSAVSDWSRSGFNPVFRAYGWEDAELAYRLHQGTPGGFKILYAPAATARHHHSFSVRQFIERQVTTGSMAKAFIDLHPEVAKIIGVSKIRQLLNTKQRGITTPVGDLVSMLDAIEAWPVVIERRYNLGSRNWHVALLIAVFELCYLRGFVTAQDDPCANYGAAYVYILERFHARIAKAAGYEAFGRFPAFPLV